MSSLRDESCRVVIDTDLVRCHLSYGELLIPGETDDTVLLSCHTCHPSLAHDNLSAIAIATMLARYVQTLRPRYSYRLLLIPSTIASLAWLVRNEPEVGRIVHGLALCLGDSGSITYQQSRRGNAVIDRVVAHVLRHYVSFLTMSGNAANSAILPVIHSLKRADG
jgi:aminopeptidase-like protein